MPLYSRSALRPAARLLRLSLPLAVMAACFWLLHMRAALPALAELTGALGSLTAWQWAGALLATAASFAALGRYDSVAHRHLGTGLDGPAARRAGMAAIAFSQTAGFGMLTGGYARWRLLPRLRPAMAARLTALVAATFLYALAAICGLALLAAPPPAMPGLRLTGALLLLLCGLLAAYSFLRPDLRIGQLRLRWPSLPAAAALSLWALADVAAAGTALWLLLPEGAGVAWPALLTAYALALGAAILSSAPAGAGPLELTLLALLPAAPEAALLAGLLAFRLVYYALPAALAGVLLAWPRLLQPRAAAPPADADLLGSLRRPVSALPADRPCAEAAVIAQNGGHLRAFGLNQLVLLDTPQASVALFDPVSGLAGEVLAPLATHANARNAAACLYKCSPRVALAAREHGWRVLRIAEEAALDPRVFCEAGSARRQLRRKLRHAEKAGLRAGPAGAVLPVRQMAALDSAWQFTHGPARGGTMGRFEPGYVSGQTVFLAFRGPRLEGFASFHRAEGEWCLDLIRVRPGAPDGTGHALVRAGIAAAAEAGVARLSLAAVPGHRLTRGMDRGLRRFKTCFAPRWEPRYAAAPSWPALALALADLARLVHSPPQLAPLPQDSASAHNEVEENEIALARTA
ncbi:phosphatidylglycerol lysyltransferase domain-containing protein [Cribrihabitans neustonicus]|uniref:phosphatidylglycerol lysyltransferase domain-containing protein n=1 Tax=Cribrihabitans neustonicus TaxID=1429085 RepID=UPI003B5B8C51